MSAADLSDEQLRLSLEEKGVKVGPITDTTRELYRWKLRQLCGSQGNTLKGVADPVEITKPLTPPPPHHPPEQKIFELNGGWSRPRPLTPPSLDSGLADKISSQFNNPLHMATDTAFLFPKGEVIYSSRAVLAIANETLGSFLYSIEGSLC